MFRTNDGITINEHHEQTESNGLNIAQSLEIIALELTLLRVNLEIWQNVRGEDDA